VKVGDHVEGLYKNGFWYKATIVKMNGDGTYTLRWADGGTQDTVKPESKIRRSTKYTVGEQVEGLYKDGSWYRATIVKINSDGTYTVEWADGGLQDTVKPESKIRLPASRYTVGEQVEGLYKDGSWYEATIVKINFDGTYYSYTVEWADGGTEDTVKPESKIRLPSPSPSALSLKIANKDDSAWGSRQREPTPVPTPAPTPFSFGWKRFGFDCHTRCPPHMRDDGLFCRDPEYGRGAGYAFWQKAKCNRRMGAVIDPKTSKPVGCEKWGAMWYPKCRVGYKNFGCCICRPPRPDCNALGLRNGIDLSCAKKIAIGRPMLGICPQGEERQLGLCYKTCREGFTGVGPVCWGKPPPGWFACGLGAVSLKGKCAGVIFDQVMSVGEMALSIATAGTSKLAEAPGKVKKSAALIKQWKELKAKYKALKKTSPALVKAEKGVNMYKDADQVNDGLEAVSLAQEIDDDDVSAADIARLAAEIASLVDPSGVAGVVSAFTYDKCTRYYQ